MKTHMHTYTLVRVEDETAPLGFRLVTQAEADAIHAAAELPVETDAEETGTDEAPSDDAEGSEADDAEDAEETTTEGEADRVNDEEPDHPRAPRKPRAAAKKKPARRSR